LPKSAALQALRAVAAVMVLLFHAHSYTLPQKLVPGGSVLAALDMGYAGVEMFFVISGFIMWSVHRSDIGVPGRAACFVGKRVLRIYPTYWVVLAGVAALAALAGGKGGDDLRDPIRLLLGATLLPLPFPPVMEIAWTLQQEILFYALFLLLILHRRTGAVALSAWAAGCLLNLQLDLRGLPASFLFSAYNLLFLMGMAAAHGLSRLRADAAPWLVLGGAALFLGTGLSEAYGLARWHAPTRTLLFGAGATMLLALLTLERRAGLRLPGVLVMLGDASYSIYLVHMPYMAVGAELLRRSGLLPWLPTGIAFLVLVASALAASVAFHRLVERPLIAFLGNRRPRPLVRPAEGASAA